MRELRLKTITGYEGDAVDLNSRDDFRNRERSFTQCGSCGADQVMNLLTQIQDAAVVEHGPAGCAGDISFRNGTFRTGNKRMGYAVHNVKYINTNLDENDTIFGGRPSWSGPSGRLTGDFSPGRFLSPPPAPRPLSAMMFRASAMIWKRNWESRWWPPYVKASGPIFGPRVSTRPITVFYARLSNRPAKNKRI